jgi:hypothetical protein
MQINVIVGPLPIDASLLRTLPFLLITERQIAIHILTTPPQKLVYIVSHLPLSAQKLKPRTPIFGPLEHHIHIEHVHC